MKEGMTSVDVAALAAELAPLVVGARVERAYQPAKERILLRLRRKGAGKLEMLVEVGRFLTLTRRPPANPDKPSMVAQILRQQLENARVIGFSQVGFDRILRIDMERGDGRSSLVAELFGDGNLLLLDGDGVITLPLRGTDYAARSLRKGERYRPPPGRPPPFGRSLDELRAAGLEAKRDLVRFLSTECGFGPQWAEELCLRAGVAKDRPAAGLGQDEWTAVHGAIAVLGEEIRRADLAPAVVHEGGRAVDAVPFTMQGYPPPRFAHEESATFAEALDALFLGATGDEEGDEQRNDPRRPRFEEAKGKLEFQLRQTDEAIATFEADERRLQVDGDLLYAAFQEAQAALAAIDEARRKAGDWASAEVELARRRAAGDAAAAAVVGLRPHEAAATLRLRDAAGRPRDVTLDARRSVQENALALYDGVKKARSRREGATKARREAEARLRDLMAKGLDGFGAAPVRRTEGARRHFWFEAYRWTVTPNGFLAVGGRNAAQNDAVVKKYLRDGDRYVHADIHGAPSVVVRPVDAPAADIPEEDLRAAGHFAVCASRAWRQFGNASAYWVTAAQVSKAPASGEFVPRGAWMVHGRRNAMDHLATEWWVGKVAFTPQGQPVPREARQGQEGRLVEKLVGGHRDALSRFADRLVRLVPGETAPADAAARLAEEFGVAVEEGQAVLPAGSVRFAEAGA